MKLFGKVTSNIEENENLTPEATEKKENILDLEVIKFVINEFPQLGEDIKDALDNLINTLDKSIDIIEDRSTEVIKVSRDYKLSGKYRETSQKLYEINKDINEYINWMDKNLKNHNEKNIAIEKVENVEKEEITYDEENALDADEIKLDDYIEKFIYEDFTGYEPCKLKLENYEECVDGWDDTIVKTADILNKKFKCDKNLNFNNINTDKKVIGKKSKQNDSRDIIIEMLEDHNISLSNFKMYIKMVK
ncbi:hypothetical protein H8S10_08135 [Clostridium sp. NSJ-49]|uniref:hypothetical protein n=2 Tax=Clostridium TaxID=1485 RepID=UPI00164B5B1D|nr:hypothetical protein [Clostridium sp. NSJ-49]MBC5625416.1 hypothetical protein [Clostridium sp. NSJ-49]